jgi:hypothetical protein
MLLAGIWPFEIENFSPTELSGSLWENDESASGVAEKLHQKFVG